jgi:hypothetical protein
MKILISILACEGDGHYVALENAIRETWGSEKSKHEDIVDIIYYYGDPSLESDFKLEGDKLWVKSSEGYFNTWNKTLMMFDFISKNYKFDYLFRTNLSSYVDLKNLQNFAKGNYKENFYCGSFGNLDPGNFCSGAGYFLSKNLIKLILSQKEKLFEESVDDLALGRFLYGKVEPIIGERFEGECSFEIVKSKLDKKSHCGACWKNEPYDGSVNYFGKGSLYYDMDHYHYRVHTTEGDRRDDIEKMRYIHSLKNE